jgi:hypothetical protein
VRVTIVADVEVSQGDELAAVESIRCEFDGCGGDAAWVMSVGSVSVDPLTDTKKTAHLPSPGEPATQTGDSDMRIFKVLDLSIAHLPQQLCASLSGWDGVTAYALSTPDGNYGWLLHVPDDPDGYAADYAETDEADGLPAEVLVIQRFARGLGCDYVLLDRDAERIDALPAWDW